MRHSRRAVTMRASFVAVAIAMSVFAIRDTHGENVAAGVTIDRNGPQDKGRWPHLRGTNWDGRSAETGLADAWPDDGPPVLWTRPLGQGYSGFTIRKNLVYTQGQTLAGQYVFCLDADTGETVWQHAYDWPFETTGLYPGPRGTPTLHGDYVFFTGPSGLVRCLNADDGTPVWSVNVKERFDGKGTDFGYSISPTIIDGMLLLPVGGREASMVALDPRDGSILWKSGTAPASYTPAFPITVDGQRQIIALMENTLDGYDLATGRLLWSRDISQGYDEHAAWPLYDEPYLLVQGPFRSGSTLYELSADEAPDVVRHSPAMSADVCSSVLVDGFVYGFDLKDVQAKAHRPSRGTFRCVDFLTGEQQWATDQVGHASVIVADGKLILFNDNGELILAAVDPGEYRELARTAVLGGDICWTPPALSNGRLYLRNHTRAVCLLLGTGDEHADSAINSTLRVTDIPQGRVRDLSWILGVEPEYAFDVPTDEWLRDWYLAGLCLMAFAGGCVAAVRLSGRPRTPAAGWWLFWTLAFLFGAVGTAPLSLARQDFTFTWPVCLFAAFQATVFQSRWRTTSVPPGPRSRSYLTGLLFLSTALAYFLLCRRLSLVTEWAFLFGFPIALPFAMFGAAFSKRTSNTVVAALTALTFTAYYAGSVGLLIWKY